MRKKLPLNLFVAFIISNFIISCSNDNSLKEDFQNSNTNKYTTSSYSNPADNANNPYDYVGQIHNEILGTYLSNYHEQEYGDLVNSIDSIALNNGNFISLLGENETVNTNPDFLYNLENDYENKYVNVIDTMNVSSNSKIILNNVFDVIYAYADMDGARFNYQQFYDDIVTIESNVIANNSLSASDKQVILSVTSTSRHSMAFWYDRYLADNSTITTFGKRRWWQWVIIGGADAIGVGVGVIVGNAPGGITAGSSASVAAYTMTAP